jgi:hypothetical protein
VAHEIDSLSQSSMAWCTWTRPPRRPDKDAVTAKTGCSSKVQQPHRPKKSSMNPYQLPDVPR